MKKTLIVFFLLIFMLAACKKPNPRPLLNTTWKGFSTANTYPCSSNYELIVKDINNDTKPDVITYAPRIDNASSFYILLNDGTGTFQNERIIPIRSGCMVQDVADINKDGLNDLLSSSYSESGILVSMAKPGLDFSSVKFFPTAVHDIMSAFADINKDGYLDLVSVSTGSGNPIRLHIFNGTASGDFQAKRTFYSGAGAINSLSISDINSDGLPDVVMTTFGPDIILQLQKTDRTFELTYITYPMGTLTVHHAVEDINNDHIPDLVQLLEENNHSVLVVQTGKGNGTFNPAIKSDFSMVGDTFKIKVTDFNQDGNLDIVTFGYDSSKVYYFIGNGDATFQSCQKLELNSGIKIRDIDIK